MSGFYKYKVSIIMAVYNVEMFLKEAIDSVVKQDIGFEHIQLILVNDGSKDGSAAICDEYAAKYPDNIVVIHKENGGVSSARNEGLKHVQGKYVNLLDSDDKLTPDTVRLVYDFFEAHKDEVDLVAIPLVFFDAETGQHPLNIKFKNGTRIIDLKKEWNLPQLSFSSAFAKSECLENLRFDSRLAYAEDAQLVVKILLEKQKMGVVAEARYLYRKRSAGESSAMQNGGKAKPWFLPCIEHFSEHTINYSKAKFGFVPLFAQYIVMYDLQWKFKQANIPSGVLTEEEEKEYKTRLFNLLKEIEDKVILEQRNISVELKTYLLQCKHPDIKAKAIHNYYDKNVLFEFNDSVLCRFERFQTKINFIKLDKEQIEIEGLFLNPQVGLEEPKLFVQVGQKRYPVEYTNFDHIGYCVGNPMYVQKGFKVTVPLNGDSADLVFVLVYDDFEVVLKNLIFGKFSPLQNAMWNSYYVVKPYILTYDKHVLQLRKYSFGKHLYREVSFFKALYKLNNKASKKAIIVRSLFFLRNLFPQKETWLISDRIDKGDDNGEALFEYLTQLKPKKIRCRFAISKGSSDYQRMKKIGKVVNFGGLYYKWLCLCGATAISSQAEDYIYRPFEEYSYCYADLIQKCKFVFLQHGVTKDDLSKWLNKNNKNINMFVTTTAPEYQSILEYPYGYKDDVVKLTGFPRYDKLYHDEKKSIMIMPSWRAYLVGGNDVHTGKRVINANFAESQYCKMYSELLTNEKLLACAKQTGYKIQFMSHPNMSGGTHLITIDDRIEVLNGADVTYKQIFAESNLLVTDYSSVVFDFAYLRKPVLYLQADREEFFNGKHTYEKGYFEYEDDGFGEVAYDVDTLVEWMIGYMQSGCVLKEKYEQRINATFPYSDKQNSHRVYEAICNLK